MTITEVVLALFVTVFSAWVAWALRRVRKNDLHGVETQLTYLRGEVEKLETAVKDLDGRVDKHTTAIALLEAK